MTPIIDQFRSRRRKQIICEILIFDMLSGKFTTVEFRRVIIQNRNQHYVLRAQR
jgi:hypothetical protein